MLRTKVVCTLGPASSTPETILAMVEGGMDLARVNMSHGSRGDHRAAIAAVRAAERQVGHPVGVMVDLSGPKIRVGELPQPIELIAGEAVVMAPQAAATP
ncbi:MAG: pyruvate kinase, partial [Gemmatimonadetes bacterium]|nr:pyruvate kinase [Gemmatimonadota bacterium]